jgi:hypothetical protein
MSEDPRIATQPPVIARVLRAALADGMRITWIGTRPVIIGKPGK